MKHFKNIEVFQMTFEFFIVLFFVMGFLLAVVSTTIRIALQNSKPTTINYGTIINHNYELAYPKDEKKLLQEEIIPTYQTLGEENKTHLTENLL